MELYDIIIVGAGPIGLACGIEAEKHNLKYIIIEKGCLVNSIYNYPVNMTFFSTSERLEIGEVPFISHGTKPTRTEALEYYRRVKEHWNLNVNTYEKVENIYQNDNAFQVESDKGNYSAKYLIIATGFYDNPNLINVPGESLPKVFHYYKEPHPFIDQKVAVIGGGNSAVDIALETYRHGAEVTLILNKNALEDNIKYWVRPDIENRIKEGSIEVYRNSSVKRIDSKSIVIQQEQEEIELENDFVFAMTGYHSDFNFLKRIGLNLSSNEKQTPIFDEETFETNIENLYLAGVVCGGMETNKWFIENSRYHAENIINSIKNKNRQ